MSKELLKNLSTDQIKLWKYSIKELNRDMSDQLSTIKLVQGRIQCLPCKSSLNTPKMELLTRRVGNLTSSIWLAQREQSKALEKG